MRHRDRVAMALAREEPDRCPMQISFTPEFAERLRADLGVRGMLNVAAVASTTRTVAATLTSSSGPSTPT